MIASETEIDWTIASDDCALIETCRAAASMAEPFEAARPTGRSAVRVLGELFRRRRREIHWSLEREHPGSARTRPEKHSWFPGKNAAQTTDQRTSSNSHFEGCALERRMKKWNHRIFEARRDH